MEHEEPRRSARWRKALAALLAVVALLLLGLWTQRKPIARGFVDRTLRARGVPARYRIADLGLGTQRLTNVSIGDPANPDLTAESVELELGYTIGLPYARAITARGVRLRGRLVDGALSLGAVDRLLPAAGGGPFTLPDLAVDVADARMRLETAAGIVTLGVAGKGNLSDDFAGRVTAAAPALAQGGCTLARPAADMAVRITDRRPRLTGPISGARLSCGTAIASDVRVQADVTLAEALSPLMLAGQIRTGAVSLPAVRAAALSGRIDYDARDSRDRHGTVQLAAQDVRGGPGSARTAGVAGRYRIGDVAPVHGAPRPVRFTGTATVNGASLPSADLRAIMVQGGTFAGSPLAPVATALAQATARAAGDLSARADVDFDGDLVAGALRGEAHVARATAQSRSGARLVFAGGAGAVWRTADGAMRLDGSASLAGGGLPEVRLTLRQPAFGGDLSGEARIAPYRAGAGRIAFAPVRFGRAGGGAVRLSTVATIDGPLGDGRVTGFAMPIEARWNEALLVNTACMPIRFATLSIAGVDLGATTLPACPVGGAMVRLAGGRLYGGIAIPRPRLAGRVGAQPLSLAAQALNLGIGKPGFVADALAVRLGGDEGTRLDVTRLDGTLRPGGVAGTFAAAAGKIARVPLLLSNGAGRWRLVRGRLDLAAETLTVADEDAAPRFFPLVSHDVTLDLTGGVIHAGGTLREPKSGLAVTNLRLVHDLGAGRGNATLDVPGITFGPAFQPEALTRLTLGVVANVAGTVSGRGAIGWSPAGVTSTGDFATAGVDLAAVFGPVTGIRGKIHFSDLLGLVTPPGQLVTVASFNPGIAVEGGVIGYQLLPGQKVAVGGGKWPFSGGSLILEPTILDFGQPVERRMTFRVEGMQAGAFISQFEFKNIEATGVFDGVLPMVFTEQGGRITGGRLVVREGGGTLAYVGELTNEDLGMFGKLAFDALKSIRYSNLAIELDGALDSEIVSRIVFTGTNENPAPGKEARGLLKNLTGLPFKFNIVIRAPFRGLTSSAQAFANPGSLLGQAAAAPAVTPATPPAVQPPLSEDKR